MVKRARGSNPKGWPDLETPRSAERPNPVLGKPGTSTEMVVKLYVYIALPILY